MARKKRTSVCFKEHNLSITKTDNLLIHYLKKEGTIMNSVKFINTNGVLVVNGDFGNWIFCREFYPSADGFVSDGYWAEKLEIYSVQKAYAFDSEETLKELRKQLRSGLRERGYTGEELNQAKEYIKECISNIEDELDYTYYAYRNFPSFMDYDDVVFEKTIHHRLKIIFDAFEEICSRIKEDAK